MKQTIFVHHSVTKWLKNVAWASSAAKPSQPLPYVTQIIKLTLNFSLVSKFVQLKYKETFYCLIQNNCKVTSLTPQFLNMGKSLFLQLQSACH